MNKLHVREMTDGDVPRVVDYFVKATPEFLRGMGADHSLLPDRDVWINKIEGELLLPYSQKTIYYTIWEMDGKPIGHCNINQIVYGKQANMHLHMWSADNRKAGLGRQLVRMSIPYFFSKFELDQLLCEPYALNPAPARTLPALGFVFEREYQTTPGIICFPQNVRRYTLSREKWRNSISAK